MNPDAFWVAYVGPMASVVDDFGTTFPRGEKVEVSPIVWASLQTSSAGQQFEFSPMPEGCCKDTSTKPSIVPLLPLTARHAPTAAAPASEPDEPAPTRRFHMSLNVVDLNQSIDFYRVLFGVEPSKCHDDYAKFDVLSPPTVFSLVPGGAYSGGPLKRIALRLTSEAEVDAVKRRFDSAGLSVEAPHATTSGYSQRYQFCAADPNGNVWEIHTVKELLDVTPPPEADGLSLLKGDALAQPASPTAPGSKPGVKIWEHRLSLSPKGPRVEDGPFDEIRLTGTMNGPLSAADRQQLLREAVRALKPGGRVELHGLFADRELGGAQPKLPGIASVVARVGTLQATMDELRAGGLVGVQIVKLGVRPAFVHEGVPLREARFAACRPYEDVEAEVEVLYKGPFAVVQDDGGAVYQRGKKVFVSAATAKRLADGPNGEQFSILQAQAAGACG